MYNYFMAAYYLASMMRHFYWDHGKLKKFQDRKVREIVKYAYTYVPFYHEKFKQLGLKPSDVKAAKDLNKLPMLTKEEIRENFEKMISSEFDTRSLRAVSTSGSTGKPLSIYINKREDEIRKAGHLRANIACGQKPRDRWVVVTPPQHHHEVPKVLRFLNIYAFIPISVFDDPAIQLAKAERMKPDILEGYSSSLLLMAKKAEQKGIDYIKPRSLIGGAELIDDPSRQFIEKAFAAPFYDQYSSNELGRMACQCPERSGYHIEADTIVMQFVEENGEEVALGETGEIVCTSLFNYAMPFIRYALGDIGILSEETDCPCGRTLPIMKVIEGRKDSIIVLPDGRELSPLVIGDGMMFFKYFNHIDHYRIIQKKVDFFKILVKKKDGHVDGKVMETELLAHIKKMLNVGESEVTIEVEFVDDIPLDETGKLRKVISEVKGLEPTI